jgi:hypothetical protein
MTHKVGTQKLKVDPSKEYPMSSLSVNSSAVPEKKFISRYRPSAPAAKRDENARQSEASVASVVVYKTSKVSGSSQSNQTLNKIQNIDVSSLIRKQQKGTIQRLKIKKQESA